MVGVDKERSEKITGKRNIYEIPLMPDPTLRSDIVHGTGMNRNSFRRKKGCASPKVVDMSVKGRRPRKSFIIIDEVTNDMISAEDDVEEMEVHAESTYMSVVELQTFAGSWKLDVSLADALAIPLEQLERANSAKLSFEVWATLLAVSVLEEKFGETRDEWEMIEMKAKQWLITQDLCGQDLPALIDLANKAITSVK